MTCEQCSHDREKHGANGCGVGGCNCGRRSMFAEPVRLSRESGRIPMHGEFPAFSLGAK